jgi:hypothetical protein
MPSRLYLELRELLEGVRNRAFEILDILETCGLMREEREAGI